MSPDEKLIYMANQIAGFFAAQGEARAVAGVADHVNKYWEPSMRERLFELAPECGTALNDLVRKALPQIRVATPG
jgi:formate dehydrogenase subunit delta